MTKYELMERAKESIKAVIHRTTGEMQAMWKGKLAEIERKLETMSISEASEVVLRTLACFAMVGVLRFLYL